MVVVVVLVVLVVAVVIVVVVIVLVVVLVVVAVSVVVMVVMVIVCTWGCQAGKTCCVKRTPNWGPTGRNKPYRDLAHRRNHEFLIEGFRGY